MEYAKHEIKLFLSEIYPEEVLKDECLDFIEKSYNALSFWGIVDKQNKNLKNLIFLFLSFFSINFKR